MVTLDTIMKVRAGGAQADQVYREGERNQGIDEGLEILNRYLDLMKAFATEDVRQIPNGIYSVKEEPQPGVCVMLKMPEHLSGEVFWRFYPNGNVAQPVTSPNDVLGIIESHPEELRLDQDRGWRTQAPLPRRRQEPTLDGAQSRSLQPLRIARLLLTETAAPARPDC